MYSDSPTKGAKHFNFERYIEGISEIILNKDNETPFSIAVNGRWGTGKTSLMKTLREELINRCKKGDDDYRKIRTVWFNAWKYPETDVLLAALSLEIHEQLSNNCDRLETGDFFKKTERWIHELIDTDRVRTEVVIQDFVSTSLSAIGIFSGMGSLSGLSPNYEKWVKKPIYKENPSFYNEFSRYLRCVLRRYICGEEYDDGDFDDRDGVLVIFIDDLDRCPPGVVTNILESINLFFDQKGCVFVLGMDINLISRAVDSRYKQLGLEGGHSFSGREYIKKMIQLEFNLPAISRQGVKDFIEKELLVGELIQEYEELIVNGLDSNPREIKRFFNTLSLMSALGNGIEKEILIKWVLLNFYSEPFVREIKSNFDLLLYLQEYAREAEGKDADVLSRLPENIHTLFNSFKSDGKTQLILRTGDKIFTDFNLGKCIFLSTVASENFSSPKSDKQSGNGTEENTYMSLTITISGTGVAFTGEELSITGTCTASNTLYLFIIGPNLPPAGTSLENLTDPVIHGNEDTFTRIPVGNDQTWEYKWETSTIAKHLTGGTYTIYAVSQPYDKEQLHVDYQKRPTYSTQSLVIRVPYITGSLSASAVAQGNAIRITGTAEGNPSQIYVWTFGPYCAIRDPVGVRSSGEYQYTLGGAKTRAMNPGTYFVIIQHPNTNSEPDVFEESGYIKSRYDPTDSHQILNNDPKGSALALIDFLTSPQCSDIYTKLTFIVEKPWLSIDQFEDKRVDKSQMSIVTLRGETNLAIGTELLVKVQNMDYSPHLKKQRNRFSGMTATVKVKEGGENNQWECLFDISGLASNRYDIEVECLEMDIRVIDYIIITEGPGS
ncbi:P-loop NTPase fold protein [Methanoculleus taiwanensis]|uniref:P-loop NTPase fold protein n=1 Tax=Methanoculleus taiwanensis TaxID=1550565 RepID=UPI0013E8E74C|nr:P-loop NTPase fold protein [Methanoculleus taiwanensis]